MYTSNEAARGKVAVWAVPKYSWELEAELRENPNTTPRPFKYALYAGTKPWQDGAVQVVEREVSIVVPAGINLVEKAVETLEEAKRELYVETQEKINKLDARIQELRLLAFIPDPGTSSVPEAVPGLQGIIVEEGDAGTL